MSASDLKKLYFVNLLTDFVCIYNYEFWLSLCKIARSSVILLLPLFVLYISTYILTIRAINEWYLHIILILIFVWVNYLNTMKDHIVGTIPKSNIIIVELIPLAHKYMKYEVVKLHSVVVLTWFIIESDSS